MPGRGEGRRNGEDEQEQDKASQQLALSASSGCKEGTPASSLELDLPRIRSALGECGGAGSQVQQRMSEQDLYQTPQVDSRWKGMPHWRGGRVEGAFCKEEKEKRNSQGKDPRTIDGNSQGGDLSTPETNS